MQIGYVPNWSEEVLVIKNVRNTVGWTYVISIVKAKKLFEHFTKKNCKKKTNQKEFRVEKVIKWKGNKRQMSNGKAAIVLLTGELIKKI